MKYIDMSTDSGLNAAVENESYLFATKLYDILVVCVNLILSLHTQPVQSVKM